MSSPFSLRLYVQDVGRADAFDKCAIPKTNGYDNSTIRQFEEWEQTNSTIRQLINPRQIRKSHNDRKELVQRDGALDVLAAMHNYFDT